jgi:TatD DNase family protein
MQLIDTHCHLTFSPLAEEIDPVIQRSIRAGVTAWITVGTDPEQSLGAVRLAARWPGVYAVVGIHPHEAGKATREGLDRVVELAASAKVVALGETGLDLHYLHSSLEDQRRVFAWHLEQAARLKMPVVIHCRDAFEQTMEVLDEYREKVDRVVFHCFTGSPDQAKTAMARGFYLSFSGVVTFRNARDLQQAAVDVPLDRVLVETDCPYLSPEPVRRQKINEPSLMIHTAGFMAGLRHMDLEFFAQAVTENARRFYSLPPVGQ